MIIHVSSSENRDNSPVMSLLIAIIALIAIVETILKDSELSGKNEQYFKKDLAYDRRQLSMFSKNFKFSRSKLCCCRDPCKESKISYHCLAETVLLPACLEMKGGNV